MSLSTDVPQRVSLAYELEASGDYILRISCTDVATDDVLWEAESEFVVPPLYDARGGELLRDDSELALWWCEPERKVSRGRPAPEWVGDTIRISAAGNEYEAAQLVLTPRRPIHDCRLSAGDLVAASGAGSRLQRSASAPSSTCRWPNRPMTSARRAPGPTPSRPIAAESLWSQGAASPSG